MESGSGVSVREELSIIEVGCLNPGLFFSLFLNIGVRIDLIL